MYWDNKYKSNGRIWGDGPSELATAAVEYLRKLKLNNEISDMLDIGCGYGRDAFYFQENLRCRILGIDVSEKAIAIASDAVPEAQKENARFQVCNFKELKKGKYDIVFTSNLYQLLKNDERRELRKTVMRSLKPNGLLFLSTFSVSDPEHYGKGVPVSGEPNSFQDDNYLHFCIRKELLEDFAFLKIKELYEHAYDEPRATGEVHHHILWILIGEHIGTPHNTP